MPGCLRGHRDGRYRRAASPPRSLALGRVIITLALTFLSKCQSWRLIQLFKFKLSEKLPCSPLSRAVLHRDARAGLWGVSLCVLP